MLRPQVHLVEVGKHFPDAWKLVDEFRADRGKNLPEWPDWCFLPLAGSYAIASRGQRGLPQGALSVSVLGALAAWRVTQGIYRFDPDVFQAVIDTPMEGKLPAEILTHLPEWCVYIETPGREAFDQTLHGFFAHLEHDTGSKRMELRFLLDVEGEGGKLLPLCLHLRPGASLKSAIADFIEEVNRQASKRGVNEALPTAEALPTFQRELAPLVSLLVYLCASNAELRPASGSDRQPSRPEPTKTKAGIRTFPPPKPTTWEAGWRIGGVLRAARETLPSGERPASQGGGPTYGPHIRRMHWHTFWKGSKKNPEERKIDVRWMLPIPVLVKDLNELPATVRKVKRMKKEEEIG